MFCASAMRRAHALYKQTNAPYIAAAAVAAAAAATAATAACLSLQEWHDQPPLPLEAEALRELEGSEEFVRVDRLLLADGGAGHAIFDTLGAKTGAVHMYRIFAKKDGSETVAVATLMPGSEGHRGVVHGGVTGLIFDNTIGWAQAMAMLARTGKIDAVLAGEPIPADTPRLFGFTANLSVNYRKPCLPGMTLIVRCRMDKFDGRKSYLKGEAHDASTGQLIADATSLFVIPKPKA